MRRGWGETRNFKMILQYEGTRYQGWQKQESSENTVQGKLEHILSMLEGSPVEINGSGRTDSGVHALGQVANAHLSTEMSCQEIMDYVNQYLPEDIAVITVTEENLRFHSRLNAKSKTYRYRVLNSAVPHIFERRYVYEFPQALDMAAMKKGAAFLVGTHDFKAFCTKKKHKKTTVRKIEAIAIEQKGDEVWFTYRGNGFLYHMVRIITGTLLEIGTGARKPEEIPEILESKSREQAGTLVPGKGLVLVEVRY